MKEKERRERKKYIPSVEEGRGVGVGVISSFKTTVGKGLSAWSSIEMGKFCNT